jgi:hypothetical protein
LCWGLISSTKETILKIRLYVMICSGTYMYSACAHIYIYIYIMWVCTCVCITYMVHNTHIWCTIHMY